MVHLTSGEGIGLLPRTSIAISILCFGTLGGVVAGLPALETSNVTLVLLGGCGWVRAVLIAACSIPVPILGATVVMQTPSIVGMASMVMGISLYPSEFGVRRGFY